MNLAGYVRAITRPILTIIGLVAWIAFIIDGIDYPPYFALLLKNVYRNNKGVYFFFLYSFIYSVGSIMFLLIRIPTSSYVSRIAASISSSPSSILPFGNVNEFFHPAFVG